jgi:ferrochelatase
VHQNQRKPIKPSGQKKVLPLIVLTKQLQNALQQKIEEPVAIAMRYGSYAPKEAYDALLQQHPGLDEVILVPLYPHYAMSSYETAVEYAKKQYAKKGYPFKLTVIKPFYNEPDYINALAANMLPWLEKEYDHILFSYHGIPERHIRKSDTTGCHCLQVTNCCDTESLRMQPVTVTRYLPLHAW